MTKIYFKLIAMAVALMLSVSVLIMSSYAWMVLSGNPAVSGIQVAIGGGNTILVAPDVKVVEGEKVYHYPGYFSDKMNFGANTNYDYLKEIGGLTPVSTSNGIDWFLSDTLVDSELMYANLPSGSENIKKGNYIYLDFWVVSPSGDYTLRVSTGDENPNGGSFVVDLLEPVKNGEAWNLAKPEGSAAAAIRIGFLANEYHADTETMLKYKDTHAYNERYTALRGLYSEPDSGTVYDSSVFTIYEPNADFHPLKTEFEGQYKATDYKYDEDHPYNIQSRITAQLKSSWISGNEGESSPIEQKFQTAIYGNDDIEESEIMSYFYGQYLQGQIAPYISKGDFIKLNANLSDEKSFAENDLAGATNDVYIIKLEQNKPQRIRMFIWLEGMDIDCEASAASARFAVNIEFAGASEKNE
ncbi:MAG: hypothetical protein IJO22_07150 [Oscillospiraceae bacterium]|nr:hypothetical protein [Oscillospiraceae bacterium]